MNESIFHNSKLQNQLLEVSVKFKIHFLQFSNKYEAIIAQAGKLASRDLANKLTGSNTYFVKETFLHKLIL